MGGGDLLIFFIFFFVFLAFSKGSAPPGNLAHHLGVTRPIFGHVHGATPSPFSPSSSIHLTG